MGLVTLKMGEYKAQGLSSDKKLARRSGFYVIPKANQHRFLATFGE
jgi:hypothetical protein